MLEGGGRHCVPQTEKHSETSKRSKTVCTWSCLQGNLPSGDRAEDEQLYTECSQNPNLCPQALGHPEGGCSEITGPALRSKGLQPPHGQLSSNCILWPHLRVRRGKDCLHLDLSRGKPKPPACRP